MYTHDELSRLAAHKAVLRQRIATHRVRCVDALVGVARPLAWLDRAADLWRRISPMTKLAIVPLGFLAQRTLFSRFKILGTLARWGPLVFSAAKSLSSTGKSRRSFL